MNIGLVIIIAFLAIGCSSKKTVPSVRNRENKVSHEANWGLNSNFIVKNCQSKTVEKCHIFRGRASQTNGSAAIEIWKVGTHNIISWSMTTPSANDVIKHKLNFHTVLYADFVGCPLKKDKPGHRIPYCIESVKNIRWVK